MAEYKDGYWWSNDGLRLHYRDYEEASHRPPILCLPGLTRNARDFEPVANRLAGQWRLICPEMRGRAESGYAKDPMTYVPLTYVQDIERSEEHTSELQSLMRISYAVFCLKKKNKTNYHINQVTHD